MDLTGSDCLWYLEPRNGRFAFALFMVSGLAMEWFIIFVLAFVFLAFIIPKNLNLELLNSEHLYQRKPYLFTASESSFLKVLDMAVRDDYRVFGKVRIADALEPQRGLARKDWFSAFAKISSKHFDYVLCDSQTFKIVAVIELDDKSHNSDKVIKRDALVNSACNVSGLPLIRFRVQKSYKIAVVRERIQHVINPLKSVEKEESQVRVEPTFKAP